MSGLFCLAGIVSPLSFGGRVVACFFLGDRPSAPAVAPTSCNTSRKEHPFDLLLSLTPNAPGGSRASARAPRPHGRVHAPNPFFAFAVPLVRGMCTRALFVSLFFPIGHFLTGGTRRGRLLLGVWHGGRQSFFFFTNKGSGGDEPKGPIEKGQRSNFGRADGSPFSAPSPSSRVCGASGPARPLPHCVARRAWPPWTDCRPS